MLSHTKSTHFLMAGEKPDAGSFTVFVRRYFAGHYLASLVLLFWFCSVSAFDVQAQEFSPPVTVTNVAQLQKLVGQKQRLNCSMALTGTVCAAIDARGVLALADDTGAEMFWVNFSGQEFKAGQQVKLTGTNCEIMRRRTGLAIHHAALINNDGVHGLVEKSATVALEAGSIPIRVEWFKQFGTGDLSLEFSGSGIPRQHIPDNYLSHPNPNFSTATNDFIPGLFLSVYEGSWPTLPDFGQWPMAASGVATNFELGRWAGMTSVGLEFSGSLQVPRAGSYTFYLKSQEGSRLFLGTPEPSLRVWGEGGAPAPSQFFIGQVLQTDASRWAVLEGHVRFAVARGGRLELELRSTSNNRLQLDVLDATGLSPELLMNAKLRVTGIGRAAFSTGGQLILGLLTVVDKRNIQIIEVPPAAWTAHPRQTPDEVAAIMKQGGGVVHLVGQLVRAESNSSFVLDYGITSLLVERTPESAALAGSKVEALGLAYQSGTNWHLTSIFLRAYRGDGSIKELPLLTAADQIARLDRNELARNPAVRLRGVVTCIWPDYFPNFVLQDSTRGVFVQLAETNGLSEVHPGDFLEVEGYADRGVFSPLVRALKVKRLGDGRFPDPVRPAWDQLVNGSLDNQYVEIEGIIIEIQKQSLILLTHWGKIPISITDQDPAVFEKYQNKLVRLRGCLLALWDDKTHLVKPGGIRIQNAIINVDESPSAEPFSIPAKTIRQLLQFDARAAAFQSVHVFGDVVGRRGNEFFLMNSNLGLRFIPNRSDDIKPGDRVEVVGYPELGGPSPVLREAVVRKLGKESLPAPKRIGTDKLASPGHDATLVQVTATLLSFRADRADVVLEMQAGLQPFVASYQTEVAALPALRAGSRLELTGVYVSLGNQSGTERGLDSFELRLDSPSAIRVLSQPPWWTFKRLVAAVGALSVLLSLVALWVFQLRRQVDSQTKIIREKAEREATLEERTRIARELHDTLEQALAGISLQLRAFTDSLREMPAESARILNMARQMVQHGQDEARRTVRNLRTLALENGGLPGALNTMAREMSEGLPVKIEVELIGSPVPLTNKVESHLLRVGQEAMTNALKHANAKNISINLHFEPAVVRLAVRDDGCGFDATHAASSESGHFGLLGMRERAEKIHGALNVSSTPGSGTIVTVTVSLPDAIADTKSE
ncbi:MAG: ATP-binding protein [Verrucomicrobiota bacterium]